MFSAEVRRVASAAEEGGLVMERLQAETVRSQITPSSPASNLTAPSIIQLPATSPGAHASPGVGLQNHLPHPFDYTGQVAPPGMKPRVTGTLWEDEGCFCFQVEARGICVARREDNHMINGTKLLNVAGMTRGRRDGILKNEKSRQLIKIGPMHLKGVWIPFERALEFANREKITELLYPLFVHDIGSLVYQPSHQRPNHRVDSQGKTQEVKEWAKRNDDHVHQIDVPEDSDKSLRRHPLDTVRNHELHEQRPIGSLSRSLIETLRLILLDVKMQSDMAKHYDSLESSCAGLFFWGTDLGLSRGELDDMLQDSPELRDTCLAVLVSISQFASTKLIHLISSEHRQKEVLQSTGISTSLEQTMNMVEQQQYSTYRPEQDAETLCRTLRTKVDTLIMLTPSLASPAEESFDDEEPRAIQDIEEYLPEQAYASSISQKFPLAPSAIVTHLGKLNWDRYKHMLRLQWETMEHELQKTATEKARTIFHDSGLGVSLPAQSEVGLNTAIDSSRPESVYASSMVSSRAEGSHKRLPPLPAEARSGEPFTCEICNKQVQFQRTKAWKKHVFDDLLAYACFFAECCDTRVFFENSEALMNHLQDRHNMDVRVSDVACPLCVEFTSGDRDILSLHIARHMEEIALGILPSGVDSDEESADDSIYSYPPTTQFTSLPTTFAELPQWTPTFAMPQQEGYGMPNMNYSSQLYNKHYAANQGYEMADYLNPGWSQEARANGLNQQQQVQLMHDFEMKETSNIEGMINQSNQMFRPPQLQTFRGAHSDDDLSRTRSNERPEDSNNTKRPSSPTLHYHDSVTGDPGVPFDMQAASAGGHDQIVKMLPDGGADSNAQCGGYSNALQVASAGGYNQIVKMLLDKGADVNEQGGGYSNALQAASAGGHDQIVKMLPDGGADSNAQCGGYSNALQAASAGGHDQTVKMLLDKGADVNAQGGIYSNALQAASAGGHDQIVKMLLDKGADVNAQGGGYSNALQAASAGGHDQVVKILLHAGAHPRQEDKPVLRPD